MKQETLKGSSDLTAAVSLLILFCTVVPAIILMSINGGSLDQEPFCNSTCHVLEVTPNPISEFDWDCCTDTRSVCPSNHDYDPEQYPCVNECFEYSPCCSFSCSCSISATLCKFHKDEHPISVVAWQNTQKTNCSVVKCETTACSGGRPPDSWTCFVVRKKGDNLTVQNTIPYQPSSSSVSAFYFGVGLACLSIVGIILLIVAAKLKNMARKEPVYIPK